MLSRDDQRWCMPRCLFCLWAARCARSCRWAARCARSWWTGFGAGWLGVPGDPGGIDSGGELLVMDVGVVPWAEQCCVVEVGGAAVSPPGDVVGVAPLGGHSASGVGAALVS